MSGYATMAAPMRDDPGLDEADAEGAACRRPLSHTTTATAAAIPHSAAIGLPVLLLTGVYQRGPRQSPLFVTPAPPPLPSRRWEH